MVMRVYILHHDKIKLTKNDAKGEIEKEWFYLMKKMAT